MAMTDTPGPMVIVGAGQAGFAAAEKLRDLGYAGPITLIGAEPERPYQRPPLSKAYLLGEMTRDRLYFRPVEHFARRDVDLRLGQPVQAILPDEVLLRDGTRLPRGRLLLATGARPRRLPADIGGDLRGVLTMRDLSDADAFRSGLQRARRLLVVDGGYVGLEAAASARKLGVEVTLVEAAPRILGRVACAETADWFRALHRDHGVDLREGVGLTRLTGEAGQLTGAILSDGQTVEADLAIVGIGVVPNAELAKDLGLTIDASLDGAISVDAHCQTSMPGVYAAGDCSALHFGPARIRLESVGNAIDQAEVAAANMLGRAMEYRARPWFWSDQYDIKLQIAGLANGYDRVVQRLGAQERSHWYFAGDRLCAVDAINAPRVFIIARRLLESGMPVDPVMIADPDFELRSLLSS